MPTRDLLRRRVQIPSLVELVHMVVVLWRDTASSIRRRTHELCANTRTLLLKTKTEKHRKYPRTNRGGERAKRERGAICMKQCSEQHEDQPQLRRHGLAVDPPPARPEFSRVLCALVNQM